MTHQKPLVSVLLPVFNAATTLIEALDSLAGQTLDKFEVIVVDDGSTDSSVEILDRWGVKDKRFHIIHREHQGIVPTLNAGLEACRADLVARMDADDISHPQRLERQYRFMCSHPQVVLVACCVNTFSETGLEEGFRVYLEWQNSLLEDEHIRREMFIESPFSHPSVMFRKHPVLDVGGYRENGMPEDYDLWLRLFIQGARFAKLPDILLEWRDSPTRLTRSDPRYSLENFLRLKAHYLTIGPLADRQSVYIWGAGMMGRRLSKHLIREHVPLVAFVDIDPRKIGRTRRGLPVLSPQQFEYAWIDAVAPVLLAAVGARGARNLIRRHLQQINLGEGKDWWFTA